MSIIVGTNGNDTLPGSLRNDRIYGLLGDDTLTGLEGNDVLSGDRGADEIRGGIGNDSLYAGRDRSLDLLFGDEGDDRLAVFANDVALGGDGTDILVFDAILDDANPIDINLSRISGRTATSIGYSDISAGQFEGADIDLEVSTEASIRGSSGDDRISIETCGCVGTSINGGRGDDILTGSFGEDRIIGGPGDDVIFGGIGPDRLRGGDGSDLFGTDLTTILLYPSLPSTIADFQPDDYILIQQEYEILPFDLENPLVVGPDPVADSSLAQFLYDTDTGFLSLDPDGTGSFDSIHVFTLTGKPSLTAADLIVDL